MAGYIGSKTVNLSTTGADIAGDADVSGALDVGGGLTVDNDGSTVLTVDRATSDGTIIDLQKSGSSVGVVGAFAGDFIVGSTSGSDAAFRMDGTNNVIYASNTSGNARDNAIDLGASTVRWKDLYLSGGVFLGGTGSANHLDDYEEGTWTPAFKDYSGSYVLQGGHYTKVGRIVTIAGTAYGNSGTNASGGFKITGLPFPAQSSGDTDYHPVFVNVERAVRNLSDLNYMSMITPSGTEIWFFRDNGNTGGMTQLVWGTDFDSNSRFRFNASYITSS